MIEKIYCVFYQAVLLAAFIQIFVSKSKEKKLINEQKNNMKKEEIYLKNYEDMINQIRIRQHNFDNHLSAIRGMDLIENNEDSVKISQKQYFEKIIKDNKNNKLINKKSSPILIGFLYKKIQQIEGENIDMEHHISIENMECTISKYEIVEITGALIDNAIEELKEKEINSKKMILEMVEMPDTIKITVKNISCYMPADKIKKIFTKGYSTKGDGRGIGLYQVKNIVRKTGNEIYVGNEKRNNTNWFYVKVEIKK